MEKANVFRLTFIGLIVIHFLNIAEQSLGKFTVWVHLLINKFHLKYGLPDFSINDSVIMLILLVVLIIFIIVATLVFLEIKGSLKLALIIACCDLIFGIAHFTVSIYFRKYFPGLVTAIFMVLLSSLLIYLYYIMMHPLTSSDEEGKGIKWRTE